MTKKLSSSLPDEVAAFLEAKGNVSGYVTQLAREQMPEARQERQRAGVAAFEEFLRCRTPEQVEADREIAEWSNDVATNGATGW